MLYLVLALAVVNLVTDVAALLYIHKQNKPVKIEQRYEIDDTLAPVQYILRREGQKIYVEKRNGD